MMERRSLLRLFALAPVAALASKVATAVEPLQLLALPIEATAPHGATPLANMRELKAYDVLFDEYVYRIDLLGTNAGGELRQLHVCYRIPLGHEDRSRDVALSVLLDSAKAEGIDLRKLEPLPMLDERMVEFCRFR